MDDCGKRAKRMIGGLQLCDRTKPVRPKFIRGYRVRDPETGKQGPWWAWRSGTKVIGHARLKWAQNPRRIDMTREYRFVKPLRSMARIQSEHSAIIDLSGTADDHSDLRYVETRIGQ